MSVRGYLHAVGGLDYKGCNVAGRLSIALELCVLRLEVEGSPSVGVWASAGFLNSLNLCVLKSVVSMSVKGNKDQKNCLRNCRTLCRWKVVY